MFTEHQHVTLRALVDRLIPEDDFPGGWDGGVGLYLARQFEGDLHPLLDMYRAGLDALESEALAIHGTSFMHLQPQAQDALLERIERGEVATHWHVEPALFFRTAVAHTAEGYYGDPGNGGNREGLAWRMIGFEVRA